MYNCSVGRAPEYLKELLSKQTTNYKLRSSQNFEIVSFPKAFSERSFSTIGPKLGMNHLFILAVKIK